MSGDTFFNYDAEYKELSAPPDNPDAGNWKKYARNGAWYALDENGVEHRITEKTGDDTAGASKTLDFNEVSILELTLTANTTITFSNLEPGRSITVTFIQDGTGSRIPTFPGIVKWPGGAMFPLSTAPGARDVFIFKVWNNGTNIDGFPAGIGMS